MIPLIAGPGFEERILLIHQPIGENRLIISKVSAPKILNPGIVHLQVLAH